MKDSAGKKRVLIIVENLPVPPDRRVWQEAQALRDAGYEVTVICPKMRGCIEPDETLEGIRILRHWISEEAAGIGGFLREYASALWGEWKLSRKAWKEAPFDIIHLCNPPDLLFLVAAPLKWRGARIIYDVHDLWPEMFEAKFGGRGPLYWAVRLAERLTYTVSDVVIATNNTVRNVALRRGRKTESDVFVVRTAPKFGDLDAPENPDLRKGRKYLVGYVGVMGNADGVHHLLEAAAHIRHQLHREDVQFLIMGTGPEYERLLTLRGELQLTDCVDMPGRVSDAFLFSALRTMDVGAACDPINEYNHGCTMNKTLEYMAFGKPQVLFATREGRESAGDAAAYVEENSSTLFATTLIELLDDPARRTAMGEKGRARLREKLSWDKSVGQLLAAYRRVLEK